MAVSILQARRKTTKKPPPKTSFDKSGEVPVKLQLPPREPGYYLSSVEEQQFLNQAAKEYERNKTILPKEFAQMYGGKAKEDALRKLIEHSKNPDQYNNDTILCFNKDGSVVEEAFDGSQRNEVFSAEDFSISNAATSSRGGGKASATKGAQGGNRLYQDKVSEEKSEEPLNNEDGDNKKDNGDEKDGNGGGKGNPVDGKDKTSSKDGDGTFELAIMCIKKEPENGFVIFNYDMNPNDQFATIFDQFVEERGFKEEDDVHFLFNNEEVYHNDTPVSLSLRHSDLIHVHITKKKKKKSIDKPSSDDTDDTDDEEYEQEDEAYDGDSDEKEVPAVEKKKAAKVKSSYKGVNKGPKKKDPPTPKGTSSKSPRVRLDNRRGRGNRKAKAWSHATTAKRQMSREVRDKLDACEDPILCVQAMSRPRHRAKGYNDGSESDTESVMNARDFPHVLPGLFFLTEQRPNGNGNIGGRKTKKPTIHFMTGSSYYTAYLRSYLCVDKSDDDEIEVEFHDEYDDMKAAIFDHDSIIEAQVSKKKSKRSAREDLVNGKGKQARR